mgnify:CR=1 FL=1|tara:strand:- start:134 stop:337 length:204 start_codon:yes stop_codon:yes gene_type:complete
MLIDNIIETKTNNMKLIKADFFREKEWAARKMITGSGVRMNSETPEETKAIIEMLQDWYDDYKQMTD